MGNEVLVHIAQVLACSLEIRDRRFGGPTLCGRVSYERAGEGPDKVTLVAGYRWCKRCSSIYWGNTPKERKTWGNIPKEARIELPW